MIDISCKFYLRKVYDIFTLHQFSLDHNRRTQVFSNMKKIASTVALS